MNKSIKTGYGTQTFQKPTDTAAATLTNMEDGNDNASETAATGWRSPSPQHGVKELTQHAQENKPAPEETPAPEAAPAPPPTPTPAPPPAPTPAPSAAAPPPTQLDSDDDSTVISSDAGPARILRVHLTKRQRQPASRRRRGADQRASEQG